MEKHAKRTKSTCPSYKERKFDSIKDFLKIWKKKKKNLRKKNQKNLKEKNLKKKSEGKKSGKNPDLTFSKKLLKNRETWFFEFYQWNTNDFGIKQEWKLKTAELKIAELKIGQSENWTKWKLDKLKIG